MADDENLKSTRRKFQTGLAAIGLTSLGAAAYYGKRDAQRANQFHNELDKGVQQIFTELEDQDYQTFDTSPQGMEISHHVGGVPDNHATFSIGIKDIYSSDIETIADKLSEDPHLEDGAEIYGMIADNIRDTSHLEGINLEFHSSYTGNKVVYSTGVDDITPGASRDDLEQNYREDFSDTIRLR